MKTCGFLSDSTILYTVDFPQKPILQAVMGVCTVAILLSFVLTSSIAQLQWLLAGLSVILLLQQTWKIVMRVRTFWTLVLSVFKYSNVIVKLASALMIGVYYCDVVVPEVLFAVSIGILPARFACVQKKQCTGNGSLSSANCQNQADKGKGLRVLHHQTDGVRNYNEIKSYLFANY